MPIVDVGGISNGQDVYDKIRAGASLVQLYTSMIYEGPPVMRRVTDELVDLLRSVNWTIAADLLLTLGLRISQLPSYCSRTTLLG